MIEVSVSTLEARARRAARKVDLIATKTRWRRNSCDNWGGFALIDPHTRMLVAGEHYEMIPDEVIEYCTSR